jgi:hypothetical protein
MFSNAGVDGNVEAGNMVLVFRDRIDDLGRLMAWQRPGTLKLNQMGSREDWPYVLVPMV